MRFLSLFSGIESASVAWSPLGWECVGVAEIEPFPCAVLKHRYPHVPNLGDITKITREQIEALGHIDAVVLGFPCQDLSVAGLRKGLINADGSLTRSGLFYTAITIIEWAKPRWTIGENVPGLFSSNGGRDFASVVGELAGAKIDLPAGGWRNTGVALGPKGLVEWTVLDAQWFGVPQRRRRVFFVRDSGDWSGRPPVLLIPHSMQGHSAPSRETRKAVAALTANGVGTCGADDNQGQAGHLIPALARCDTAREGQRQDFETETLIAHTLRGEGFDASEDGTGRGTPLEPVAYRTAGDGAVYEEGDRTAPLTTATDPNANIITFDTTQITSRENRSNPKVGDPCHPLAAGVHAPAIAFSCKDHGADAGDISPTLRSMGHDGSHANGDGQVAIAFQTRIARNGRGQPSDVVPALNGADAGETSDMRPCVAVFQQSSMQGKGTIGYDDSGVSKACKTQTDGQMIHAGTAVRRLTAIECARLQGFPDDYLSITYRGKPACDGVKYKALGNSFAVPVVAYIGRMIEQAIG